MFVVCPKCGAKYQIPSEISLNYGQRMQCSACGHYFVLAKENSFSKNESIQKERETVKKLDVAQTKQSAQPVSPTVLPEVFQPSMQVLKRKPSLFLPLLLVIVSLFILFVLLGLAWQYREELKFQNQLDAVQVRRSAPLRPAVQPEERGEPLREVPVDLTTLDMQEIQETLPEEVPLFAEDNSPDFSFRSLRFNTLEGEMPAVQIEGIIKNEQDYPMSLPEVIYVNAYDVQGRLLFQKEIYFTQKKLMPHQEQAFFGTYSPAPKEIKWIDAALQK